MRNVPLFIDLAFCIVFLPLMIWLMPKENWMLEKYPSFLYLTVAWLYVIYIANRHITVPLLFRGKRKVVWALALLVVSACVTYLLTHIEMFAPLYGEHSYYERYPQRIIKLRLYRQTVWLQFIIAQTFSFAVGILTEFNRQRQQREAMEHERNRAELALYKAQINPHFLFNTLNTLYGLLITQSGKTIKAMEQFISLTKYLYNNANCNLVPLCEEIEYLQQYIELQKLRLNEMADVRFTYDITHPESLLPPMLLTTFVENAFKYGISANEKCFIHIRLCQHDGGITFEARNSVFANMTKTSKKMGLENCRRRLELLYPDRHKLTAERKEDGTFYVYLWIKFEELRS
ncbi:MAG: sensor histidine kinase [Prevotella sp.]